MLICGARLAASLGWIGCPLIALAQQAPRADAAGGRPSFELEWRAPAECAGREQARAAIEALLSPTASTPADAQVEVGIERTDDGRFNAEIRVRRGGREGERRLSDESCARLGEAAAMIVAMVLDPAGAAQRAKARPEPPASGSPEPEPEQEIEQDEPDESLPSQPWRVSIGLRLAGDVGSLPSSTGGAGLVVGLRHGMLQAQLAVAAWLPQDTQSGPVAGSFATIGLYSTELRGCLELAAAFERTLALGGCAAAEAGLSTGDVVGISDGRANQGFWSAGLLGLFARQELAGSLELELMAELGAPLHRPTYRIDEFRPVFRASPWIARLSLGVVWLFP